MPFSDSITWASNAQVVWPLVGSRYVDAIRGDLAALRASGGQFAGTVQLCLLNDIDVSAFTDGTLPNPSQGFYYLVKRAGYYPCDFDSWGTGSSAEVPGAGGDRDADIALDPDTCP